METYSYTTTSEEAYKTFISHLASDEVTFTASVKGDKKKEYKITASYVDFQMDAATEYVKDMGLEFTVTLVNQSDNPHRYEEVKASRDINREQFQNIMELHEKALSRLDAVKALLDTIV